MGTDQEIEGFLYFMTTEKGASDNTVSAYGTDLTQLNSFLITIGLDGNPMNWRSVTKNSVLAYISELKERRYAEATISRKVAAMKSFFQYLHAEGLIRTNPTESIASPRVPKTLPKTLSVKQVDDLLEQPAKRNTPEALRDQAMLELLYSTGMLNTELVSLDLDSVSLDTRRPHIRCMGKDTKKRTIPIHNQAHHILATYLNSVRPKMVHNKKESALFISRRGKRITRQGFWLSLKQYAHEAGIEALVTPSTLRHSFATHMLQVGASLRDVQELLGHADISTTQVYAEIVDGNTRVVYERAHPRAK